jgi:hypothetical protein
MSEHTMLTAVSVLTAKTLKFISFAQRSSDSNAMASGNSAAKSTRDLVVTFRPGRLHAL